MDTAGRDWRHLPAVRGWERLVWSLWERQTFPGWGKHDHQWTRLQRISKRVGPSDRQIPMAAWCSWRSRSCIGICEWPGHRRGWSVLEVLDASSGTRLYSYTTGGALYAAPSVANGQIFTGGMDDN